MLDNDQDDRCKSEEISEEPCYLEYPHVPTVYFSKDKVLIPLTNCRVFVFVMDQDRQLLRSKMDDLFSFQE